MPKTNKTYQQQADRWQKEGRGSGQGSTYKPWLTVRDVSSNGRSHRVFGRVAGRIHHLLSDLELSVLLLLDWDLRTLDIREQFPLILPETQALADKAGIKHPAKNREVIHMTTDFLVDTSDNKLPRFALQAKYSNDLNDPRTVEKLELERRYWESKSVPWFIVTEREIPKEVLTNIEWLIPYIDHDGGINSEPDILNHYLHYFASEPDTPIIEVGKKLDRAYDLKMGESLSQIRSLLAQRQLVFDITKPYSQLTGKDISITETTDFSEVIRVSEE